MNSEKANSSKASEWIENITDLVESYRDLISLRVVSQVSLGISQGSVAILSVVLTLFVMLFAGLGLAWWLGELLNDMKMGFFLVGGGYLLFFLLLMLTSRKWIIPAIRNTVIKRIYDQD